jgi:LysM repeat protein
MQCKLFVRSIIQQARRVAASKQTKLVRLLGAVLVLVGATLWTPALHAADGVHTVARGESLSVIAKQYNVSMRTLMASNGISNPDYIYVGQRLVIPGLATTANGQEMTAQKASGNSLPNGNGYYVVRRGDTLSQIAKGNGLSTNDLLRLNGLSNPNVVWVGQKLRLTARVAVVKDEKAAEPKLAIIHVFKAGDTVATLAEEHNTTVEAILRANGLPHEKFIWVGQRLRIQPQAKPAAPTLNLEAAPADGRRWIEVNLSNQTLTAWQGDTVVMHTYISSGLSATPTVTGRFSVGRKYSSQRMVGPGYDLPGVPWVMYFYSGYAIHGAYWHNNFGAPMSHGCVNMTPGEAQILYNWAPIGTEVYVHY